MRGGKAESLALSKGKEEGGAAGITLLLLLLPHARVVCGSRHERTLSGFAPSALAEKFRWEEKRNHFGLKTLRTLFTSGYPGY